MKMMDCGHSDSYRGPSGCTECLLLNPVSPVCPHVAGLSGMCMGCAIQKAQAAGQEAVDEPMPPSPKEARIAFLERKRAITIEDGRLKLEGEDWHGVADAAMDLRDIDNELFGLRY